MDRPNDTPFPVNRRLKVRDLGGELAPAMTLRPIKGPLDILLIEHDKIQQWNYHLILGLLEKEAARNRLTKEWRDQKDKAIGLGREYLCRNPLSLPEEADWALTRSEAQKLGKYWESVADCFETPIALTKGTGRELIALGFALNPKKYQVVLKLCSTLLARTLKSLLELDYNIPALPRFGKKGIPSDEIEFYTPNDFEILGACFQSDVKLFVTYLTHVQEIALNGAAAASKEKAKAKATYPHMNPFAHRLRTTTSRDVHTNQQSLRPCPMDSDDEQDPRVEVRTSDSSMPRFPHITLQRQHSRHEVTNLPSRGRHYTEFFGSRDSIPIPIPIPPIPKFKHGKPTGGDPSDNGSSDSGNSDHKGKGRKPPLPPSRKVLPPYTRHRHRNLHSDTDSEDSDAEVSCFDLKFKMDVVPTWDGNTTTLANWLLKINLLAKRSKVIFDQLGSIVPQRFRGSAEDWFYSLPESTRDTIQVNWNTLKDAIRVHYMNRHWLDLQKAKANKVKYREAGYTRESPSEYFIRKLQLLELVFDYSDAELIAEIMAGAPVLWNTILNPRQCLRVTDLQNIIKYYEETLSQLADPMMDKSDVPHNPFSHINDVPHLHSGQSLAYDSAAAHNADNHTASDSDDADMQLQNHTATPLDVSNPPSPISAFVHLTQTHSTSTESILKSEGDADSRGQFGPVTQVCTPLTPSSCVPSRHRNSRQFPIHTQHIAADTSSEIYVMPKLLTQPPGTSFRSARAVQVQAHIGLLDDAVQQVIIDSGSDITLISKACWESLSSPPQLETNHHISLVQVTGLANVNGYIRVNLYFATPGGFIQLAVDAYVVDGMSTPFILGNDFQDQYLLSILREEGNTEVVFGNSGMRITMENSTSPSILNERGHASGTLKSPKLKAFELENLMKSRNQATSICTTEPFAVPHFTKEKRYRQAEFSTSLAQKLTIEKTAENVAEMLTIARGWSNIEIFKTTDHYLHPISIPISIPIPFPEHLLQSAFSL